MIISVLTISQCVLNQMRQYKGKCFVNQEVLCTQYAITVADCNVKTKLLSFCHSLDFKCLLCA